MANEYDVVVLGGGTGGYVAALEAAKKGQTVALVEQAKLGGTCLHRGCIPTKALLRSAEVLATVQQAAQFGVNAVGLAAAAIDFKQVQTRKQAVIDQLEAGIVYLIKKGKIDLFTGTGAILGPSIFFADGWDNFSRL
ncbi:dihydrolipoamide dehydrogenase [Brochothrix campestris FSL F6-1037]|uniref:Dihydrolipoamide dehydrogenase n=1 Tax=Brochothrix campestris FSL F6-1037 TaxID=1265861 RepID=W7CY64_9LIST|nr:dihydrolipoamide dehydrogenase [Brochothrix campestris FSL F6-1037]